MPLGTVTGSLARPSIAAFVSGRPGTVGESFPIDFGIDPSAIPRHSFIAVERGEFDPAVLKGKDVIIGATAIELGDRYAVPRHGVLPGVVVQALAAETLVRRRPGLRFLACTSRRGHAARLPDRFGHPPQGGGGAICDCVQSCSRALASGPLVCFGMVRNRSRTGVAGSCSGAAAGDPDCP